MTQPQIAAEIVRNNIDCHVQAAEKTKDENERALHRSAIFALNAALIEIEAMPRSSPQVVPGLRDVIDGRLKQYNEQLIVQRERSRGSVQDIKNIARLESARSELSFVLRDIDRAAEAADIAAAQGGQVVDRDALVAFLQLQVDSAKGIAALYVDQGNTAKTDSYSLQAKLLESIIIAVNKGQFNAAVPSAPGAGRVREAWAVLENDLKEYWMDRLTTVKALNDVREAIAALGEPQGSDAPAVKPPLGKVVRLHVKLEDGTKCVYCGLDWHFWLPMDNCKAQ